jgi:hypothetical protein
MRTTLTIDDELGELLKRRAFETGKPFKQVVNEALRLGLQEAGTLRPARPYRLEPEALGTVAAGVDLVKALRLAGALEDAELVRKLELRK